VNIITVDFETYYDKAFSLSKLTTDQYVRSPEFEVIGLAVKVNSGETDWISGPFDAVKKILTR
jgi:DNA polymerase